jgi:hypothetical protein
MGNSPRFRRQREKRSVKIEQWALDFAGLMPFIFSQNKAGL